MVKSSIFGIKLLALELDVSERVLRRTRTVEHGKAILHELAVIDQRVLDRHTDPSGTSDNADLIDISQTLQAGTKFGRGIVMAYVVEHVVQRGNGIVPTAQPVTSCLRTPAGQDVEQSFRT